MKETGDRRYKRNMEIRRGKVALGEEGTLVADDISSFHLLSGSNATAVGLRDERK